MNIKLEPLPNYGEHMTLDRFIEDCKSGSLIDYDGLGYYATKDNISNKSIVPSDVTGNAERFNMKTGQFIKYKKKINVDKNFTHVVWLNK
jgi:hypothetical protein